MKEKQEKTTEELMNMLLADNRLDSYFNQAEDELILPKFHEYISELCKIKDEIPAHVIARADIEKSFGHQLFSGKRKPSRDTVIQLAFGFQSSVDEAQHLLKLAGFSALYPRVKRDSVIIHCLNKNISLIDTQLVLDELDLPILGGAKYDRN